MCVIVLLSYYRVLVSVIFYSIRHNVSLFLYTVILFISLTK